MVECSADIPLPPGYLIGQRIVTNKNYARCNPKSPPRREGVIIGGSRCSDGPVTIRLDGQTYARPLPLSLFDVVVP